MTDSTIESATRAVVQLGFSIVVAGVLLWFVLGRLTADLDLIASRMDQQLAEMKEHTRLLKDFVQQRSVP